MCPVYVAGVIGPGWGGGPQERRADGGAHGARRLRSVAPLHISCGVWDAAPLEAELATQANKLVGATERFWSLMTRSCRRKDRSPSAWLRNTPWRWGRTPIARRGFSLTLAQNDIPAMIRLRLFLPESWTSQPDRDDPRRRAGSLPGATHKTADRACRVDRVIAARVRFGVVLADAGYGLSAPFRHGLDARGLSWAIGIPKHQKSIRSQSNSASQSRAAVDRASVMSPINRPSMPKTCSLTQNGGY